MNFRSFKSLPILMVYAICGLSVAACSPSGGGTPSGQNSAPDRAANQLSDQATGQGGAFNGGGGGNATGDFALSYDQMNRTLPTIVGMLPYVFQMLEGATMDAAHANYQGSLAANAPAIYKKLFPKNAKTIYDVLPKFKYTLLEHGVCKSPNGEDVDGSASPTGEVCLSYERLTKKVIYGNRFSKLTSLMAHEVSHLLGTTEPEAQTIQTIAEGVNDKTYSQFHDHLSDLKWGFKSVEESLDQTLRQLDSGTYEDQCVTIGTISGRMEGLQEEASIEPRLGILVLNMYDQESLLGIDFQSGFLKNYCGGQSAATVDSYFKGRKVMPVAEAVKISNPNLNVSTLRDDLVIYSIHPKDQANARAQVENMLKILREIKARVEQITYEPKL